MKFAYKFSSLLGSVYKKGNVLFTPDGNVVISPVGNKISFFDLKTNKSETLGVESRFNVTCLALAPNGHTLIAVNEEGEALLISLISKTVLHKYRFNKQIRDIKFSPDGRHYAVTKEDIVFLFKAPGPHTREFNPFVMERIFKGAYDETTCLDWTSDSRVLAVGSKDMSTRIYAVDKFSNLSVHTLGGHRDAIVGCFFEDKSLDLYTVSRNGQLCVWECNTELSDLIPWEKKEKKKQESDNEDDVVEKMPETIVPSTNPEENTKFFYKRHARHYLKDLVKADFPTKLTAAAFHRQTHMFVSGLSNGAFFIHEMPEFNLIHSLSMAEQHIATLSFNNSGDWIAVGCRGLGQLIVWEWQSESYIMKQQGHFHTMNCLAYSPDAQHIVTGGDDAKVKLWNTSSGFCFVTFTEHQASISGVIFTQTGKVVVSSSYDGTVRAFDLHRYRNFRTFTSPRPVQFACVAVDSSGEFVTAGAQDTFEIFVWSMKNGRLLEILSGHEGPVSGVCFSPSQALLASASWDKTLKLWDVFESKSSRETIALSADALAVSFRPDGQELAVATLDGQLTFFHVGTSVQTSSIEGRNDLDSGRRDTDLVTAKKVLQGKAFNTLCYSADGQCILAAGQSKNVCIYNIAEQILVKKFEITQNRSFDGMDDIISRRKMTEFGNVALVEERDDDDSPVAISLPGVRRGDMASRAFRPEVRVSGVCFSPTGRLWAATTTEGLLVYSLDSHSVFDPFELELGVTPASIRKVLAQKEYTTAIMQAFKLNEEAVITEVLESIPASDIQLVGSSLPLKYVERLLRTLGPRLESSRHLEFYLLWIRCLLMAHGQRLKERSMDMKALLCQLQKSLTVKYKDLRTVCEHNKYSIDYIISLGCQKKRKALDSPLSDSEGMDE